MLVIDANVALRASGERNGFATLGIDRMAAPPLMWSEARAALHLAVSKREAPPDEARAALKRLESAPVERRDHERLGFEAWRIADALGWGRTYDAEYLALASLLGCRLLTEDRRLRRGADRLNLVIAPEEL